MGFKVLKHNDYSKESISSCYQSTTQNVKTGAKKSAFSTWLARWPSKHNIDSDFKKTLI